MNPLLLSFADGTSFFIGLLLVFSGVALLRNSKRRPLRSIFIILAIFGMILVILSATPLPLWVYLLWIVFATAGLFVAATHNESWWRAESICTVLLGLVSLALFCSELPHHKRPQVVVSRDTMIYVLGDSISAGMGNERATWPEVLSQTVLLETVNLAQAGATVNGAIRQARMITAENALVIIEIGGNDLLGSGEATKFRESLDALVGALRETGHDVLLVELPLFPFQNGFGAAQRSIARKYEIPMLPKRAFTRVLAIEGATSDGLHLSQIGHDAMAQTIADVLEVR